MKNIYLSLAVASLLMFAACSGGEDTASTTPAGGSGNASTPAAIMPNFAPAPADGTTILLDVSGMT